MSDSDVDYSLFGDAVFDVVLQYIYFLSTISHQIKRKAKYAARNKRKFVKIRNELYNHLMKHWDLVRFENLTLVVRGRITGKIIAKFTENYEKLLNLKKMNTKVDLLVTDQKAKWKMYETFFKDNITARIKEVLHKQDLQKEDFMTFLDKHRLTNDENLAYSSYKEHAALIKERTASYIKHQVTARRIVELTFKFAQGSDLKVCEKVVVL